MKTTIVRDFSSPDDYFLCRCNIEESSKAAGNREEPKPICSLELYTKGLHLRLPFYNATRWEKIRAALTRIVTAGPALTFEEFTNLFGSYVNYQLDLSALAMLIDSGWRGGTLLTELLPEIARLALDLPNRIRQPIRLLRAGENGSLTLSQRQAASLLACAFFCTFPGGEERANYNRINFTKIFHKKTHRAVEKLKCVLHYFSEFVRTSRLAPKVGTISIIRQQFPAEAVPVWAELDAIPLGKLTALPTGKIEDQGPGMTQMDFANKFIGGGVLGHGAVQEEIRFLICPELLISCLVCEKVKRDEAILLIGADRYSDYEGYARTFRWKPRRWEEPEQRDPLGHSTNSGEVLAIDALHYAQLDVQFERRAVDRELLKALAGFSLRTTNSPEPIATGNWGCGAFGGELHLKSLIQLIAASVVGRPLFYFTFDDQTFAQELDESVKLMEDKGVTIGRLYRLIIQYGKEELVRPRCLLGWIRQQLTVNSKDDVPM